MPETLINSSRFLFTPSGFTVANKNAWPLLTENIYIATEVVIFASYIFIPLYIICTLKKLKLQQHKAIIWLCLSFAILASLSYVIESIDFANNWSQLALFANIAIAFLRICLVLILVKIIAQMVRVTSESKENTALQNLIQKCPHPTLIMDEKLKVVSYNSAFCQYLDYSPEELIGLSCTKLFPAKKRDIFVNDAELVFNTQGSIKKSFTIKDVRKNTIKIEIALFYNECNKRKDIWMSLKDNEQNYQFELTSKKLKGIFDSALDGIITVNDCGTIQSFNLAAERIFGYSADEVIGSNYKILIPNYFINKYDTHLSRYINTGETVISGARRILHGRTKNGQIVPLELSLSSIKINNELILTGILRDISERILMEQKILTAYNELESFSYIAAHDLREPLRGISNYATFLIEDYQDKIDTEGINKLQTLKKLSLRLENFIESLLHYSKLSNGDKEYTVEEANHLVNEVIAGLDIMIKENNVQIIFHRNLPAILCNAILVTELFFNLISNSIKYNDKNKKIVEIGCIKDDENYNYQTVFFVKDNGIGIKEEHFNIIFRIFKRLHPRDQFGGGSGAGLAIVKKIVTMHNGKIWLESELNKGTTFYFTLGQYEK